MTYEQIGTKLNISAERVRQILTYKLEFCSKHKRQFVGECSYCKTENEYYHRIDSIVKDGLMKEINELKKHNRKRETVIKRIALIRVLRDKYLLPFSRIAVLLERDISSIKNLYNSKHI